MYFMEEFFDGKNYGGKKLHIMFVL